MPQRTYFIISFPLDTTNQNEKSIEENLIKKLDDGWVLDPLFQSKPIRVDGGVIYHLIKYTPEELEQLQAEEIVQEREIVSMRSVSYDEVDALIQEGYVPAERYAKNVTVIKYKEPETE